MLPPDHPPYQPRVRRPSPNPSSLDLTAPPERASPPYTNQPLALGPSQPLPSAPTAPAVQRIPVPANIARLQPPRVQSLAHPPLGPGTTGVSRTPTPNLDFAGMQAEIDRVHESAASAARETLRQIFPTMDVEIMDLVLEANGGDLGKSIESLLEMSSGT